MWTADWFIREIELPYSVGGAVVPNSDGTFDIYLNSLAPAEVREEWLRHEIRHITEDHFYRAMGIADIEREADGIKKAVPEPERLPGAGEIMRFSSLAALIEYYRADMGRVYRDYAGIE